jgi:hypothetical protein
LQINGKKIFIDAWMHDYAWIWSGIVLWC